MQLLVGSDDFQHWLDTTPLRSIVTQLASFCDEGATYRALQKERLRKEKEMITGQDVEIGAWKRVLEGSLASMGAQTQLSILLSRQLSLLESRQNLHQRIHAICQDIEDVDQGIYDNAARYLQLTLRMKQGLVDGSLDPVLKGEFVAALGQILPMKEKKEEKRRELVPLRGNGARLEREIEGVEGELAALKKRLGSE
jgi:hypothetical protein